ncbi:MAG: EAL domain-containing protein [Actinomycetales bacterium]|nr:EAL domain-containing protein [Actinomycetales bacterium]
MTLSPNRRILLVDDAPAIHEDFAKILGGRSPATSRLDDLEAELFGSDAPRDRTATGFQLDSAFQGREALAMVRASLTADRPYALAFVDMRMPPGWDGVETIERIWECDPRIQVVICTAYSDHSWHDVLHRLDVSDRLLVLKKPFEEIEVLQLANALTVKWQRTLEAGLETAALERLVNERTAALGAANLELRKEMEEHRRAEAELRISTAVFDHSPDGIAVLDAKTRVVSLNPAFTAITGYTATEMLGRPVGLLYPGRRRKHLYRALLDTMRRHGHGEGEIRSRRKDGEEFLAHVDVSGVGGGDGPPDQYVLLVNDVTELRRKDEHIHRLAFHDELTRLPNRALLADRLGHRIALARRTGNPLGILFVDLDRFKVINDSCGYDVGNRLLTATAERLKDCLRDSDTIARVGGDEFLVVLTATQGPEEHAVTARRVIAQLSRPLTVDGRPMQVGASVGIACYPDDGADAAELMTHAEAAMRSAKSSGGGTYRFFRQEMTARAQLRLQVEMELRDAVRQGGLELFYQPKVTVADEALCGAEALVRWRHPDRGLVGPLDFIPLAEETGIITDLGLWVLDEACRQSRAWRDSHGEPVKISVNISAVQVCQGDLVKEVVRACDRHDVDPADLELELTESMITDNLGVVSSTLAGLREIGSTVAVDDFGTGYSSFVYLRDLPVDVLKIDRSFVMDMERRAPNQEIVKAIVSLGRALSMDVVAEGVETREQADLLRSHGCRTAQGYLFSRPVPAEEFERSWLHDVAPAP